MGDMTSLGMRVLVGVSVRGGGRGRKQASATVINSVCAHPLRASEEFITATLLCRQARIIWIMLLSRRAGLPHRDAGRGLGQSRPPGRRRTGCRLAPVGTDLARGAAPGRAAGPGFHAAAGQSRSSGITGRGGNGMQRNLGKGMAKAAPGLVRSSVGTPPRVLLVGPPDRHRPRQGLLSLGAQPCTGVGARADPRLLGPP